MNETEGTRHERVRMLNDFLRRSFQGGKVMVTAGLQALEPEVLAAVLAGVREFDAFSEENDPYEEHDFGAFEIASQRIFWKIDYYDPTLSEGSDDPADPSRTVRVLTIMLAAEY